MLWEKFQQDKDGIYRGGHLSWSCAPKKHHTVVRRTLGLRSLLPLLGSLESQILQFNGNEVNKITKWQKFIL